MTFHYFDASALTKLLLDEAESEALAGWIDDHGGIGRVISSDLAHTEVRRTVHRLGGDEVALTSAEQMLNTVVKVRLSPELLIAAGDFAPGTALRTLDAIHVAAAVGLGQGVSWFVTYDKRQAECAARAGLDVASPN